MSYAQRYMLILQKKKKRGLCNCSFVVFINNDMRLGQAIMKIRLKRNIKK